ncbi:hypothetical protein AALA13_16550 [Lachnospiraceae bacterium 50-23]
MGDRGCENCVHRIRDGEEYACGEYPARIVLDEDFCQAECYFWCEGKEWKKETGKETKCV